MSKVQYYAHWLITTLLVIAVYYNVRTISVQNEMIKQMQASIVLMYDTIELEKTNRELGRLLDDLSNELNRYEP